MRNKFYFFLTVYFLSSIYSFSQNPSLRVAHFNIGQLSMGKEAHTMITKEERENKVADFKHLFKQIDAEVFCFCEYAPYFSLLSDSTEDKEDLTREAILDDYPFYEINPRAFKNCNGMVSKNLCFSNKKMILYSQGKGKRDYTVSEIEFNGEKVLLVETHLDVANYKDIHDSQVKELIDTFMDEKYVIICGDFNMAKAADFDVFKEAGFSMANHGSFGNILTYPTTKGGYFLDNIICKGFDILSVHVYDTKLSDHFALSCDLQMKDYQQIENTN